MSTQYAILSRDEYEAMWSLGHHLPIGFHVYVTIKMKYMDHKTFVASGCGYASIANEYDNDELQKSLSGSSKLDFKKPTKPQLKFVYRKLVNAGLLQPLHKQKNGAMKVQYLLPMAKAFVCPREDDPGMVSEWSREDNLAKNTPETQQPCGLHRDHPAEDDLGMVSVDKGEDGPNSLSHYSINTSSTTSTAELRNSFPQLQPNSTALTLPQNACTSPDRALSHQDASRCNVEIQRLPGNTKPVKTNPVVIAIADDGHPYLTLSDLQRRGLRKLFHGTDQQFETELFSCAMDAHHRGMLNKDLFNRARNWMINASKSLTKAPTGGKQSGQLKATQASSYPSRRGRTMLTSVDDKLADIDSVVERVRRSAWEADSGAVRSHADEGEPNI